MLWIQTCFITDNSQIIDDKCYKWSIMDHFFMSRIYPAEFQKGAVTVTTGTVYSGFKITELKFALITHAKSLQQKKKKQIQLQM